jgi:hypothetical protein
MISLDAETSSDIVSAFLIYYESINVEVTLPQAGGLRASRLRSKALGEILTAISSP